MAIFKFKFMPVLLLCWLVPVIIGEAAELTPQEKVAGLQAAYEATTSFAADFTQLTTTKLSRRERHGEGSLVIKKPGLIRWDYQEPDRQVIICDGERISMYFAEAEQMIVMPAKDYLQSDVTYAFFAGNGDILRDFEISAAGDDYCCGTPPDLMLTPKKPHPQVEYLYLWLNKDFLINRMQIADHYGSITDLTFTDLKLNPPVQPGRFEFVPPPGTDIVEQ